MSNGYNGPSLYESLCRYIGRTVTIFTTSGGVSGCGFTGVLASVDCDTVRLITSMGAPPACPVGSSCEGCCYDNDCGYNGGYSGFNNSYGRNQGCGCNNDRGNGFSRRFGYDSWVGSITEIPICSIATFVHSSI